MRVLLVAQLPPFSLQPLHLRLVPAWAVGRGTLLACSRFVHGVLKSSEVPPAFFDGSPIFLDLLAIVCAEKATAPVVVRRDAVEVAASKDQPRVVAQADLGYGFRDVLGFASPGDDARVLYGILICEQHHAVHLGLIQQAVEGHVVVDDHAVGDARAAESGHVKICCLPARRSRERHHLEAPAHASSQSPLKALEKDAILSTCDRVRSEMHLQRILHRGGPLRHALPKLHMHADGTNHFPAEAPPILLHGSVEVLNAGTEGAELVATGSLETSEVVLVVSQVIPCSAQVRFPSRKLLTRLQVVLSALLHLHSNILLFVHGLGKASLYGRHLLHQGLLVHRRLVPSFLPLSLKHRPSGCQLLLDGLPLRLALG
mmetsp:Transcript_19332/g.73026  ORF Transcript_19332/g.73026 Transcript_19332/m.73026 type:complete len:372 (+) Transcript_19332:3480-4595(+)